MLALAAAVAGSVRSVRLGTVVSAKPTQVLSTRKIYIRDTTNLKSEYFHLHHLHLESLRLLRGSSTGTERVLVIRDPRRRRGLLV